MVRYIFFVMCFSLVFIKCSKMKYYKSEPITEIDTSAIYTGVAMDESPFFIDSKDTVSISSLNKELRFYSNNKVEKKIKDSKWEGVYYKKNGIIYMKFRNYHVQSGYYYSTEKIRKITQDTLKTEILKSPQTIGITNTYIKKSEN